MQSAMVITTCVQASQVAQLVKNQPASAGDARDTVSSMGQDDPLKKKIATHSSIQLINVNILIPSLI